MKSTIPPFEGVADELRRLGIQIKSVPGEYHLNFQGQSGTPIYITDDLTDALEIGRVLAEKAPVTPPPLGPTGRQKTRRGVMHAHNRKIAARRRRKMREED